MPDTLICPPGLAETPVLTFAETVEELHARLATAVRWYVPTCSDAAMNESMIEALALCTRLMPAVRKAKREGV